MDQDLDPKRVQPESNPFQSIDSIVSLHPIGADIFCSSAVQTVHAAFPFHNPQKHMGHSHQIAHPCESASPSNRCDRLTNPPHQHQQNNQYTLTSK